ncbi:Ribulokinase [Paenibacillus konkukensis]|uniref:Ribulokinase n=1 Tax=Paenibacillus konkukensis TaxID=2020716 RepID=A0ABY4RVN4_9BACL|nr:ribulokinase [Paenibacillus konkukensis]UQZ86298.1 Ribulokinase [Paenibacillus konkukensis]
MDKRYALGIDFGTESGRAVLVDIHNGEELASHITPYPHGVMDERLPGSGRALGANWALQHPEDYMAVLRKSVPAVMEISGIHPARVIGIGIDFTACTMLPIDRNGVPLCYHDAFRDEPHAYVKLWKHHAAQEQANRINETARRRGEPFLSRYGGKSSSEWMLAKAWQVLSEAPHVYDAADRFMEAADWVVGQLAGRPVRSGCCAGYKAFWSKEDGYPGEAFLRALDPRLERFAIDKLRGEVLPLGERAGELTEGLAAELGLAAGTAVAVGIIDAHAGVAGVGAVHSGQMVMAMGTSLCHMLISDKKIYADGVSGVVEDGIIPGLYGYEAGQPAVGDIFGWFVEHQAPAYVTGLAESEGIGVHDWLERRAAQLRPGQHGLLALDWWNGNRSVLVDADLSGLIVGLTLQTKPEEIYRALLEATAFGTRKIIETLERAGVEVKELLACGGLPKRNRLLMQIYADVTGRTIKVAASEQTTALGAAMFGAVAAGPGHGGYSDIAEAARHMARVRDEYFVPDAERGEVYDRLYRSYVQLHDLFGRGGCEVMKELLAVKLETSRRQLADDKI